FRLARTTSDPVIGETMFRYLMLGLLRDGKSRHGYALMKELEKRSGLSVSTGSFYRELPRLESEGLVEPIDRPEEADQRQLLFRITPSGVAKFDDWLARRTGSPVANYNDDIWSRVLFLAEADAGVARRVLDWLQETLWFHGKTLEREREAEQLSSRSDRRFHVL